MAEVWVLQPTDYDEYWVWGVAESLEAAVAWYKAKYGPPYKVRWDDPEQIDTGEAILRGHFQSVPGYSTAHTDVVSIKRYEVIPAAGNTPERSEGDNPKTVAEAAQAERLTRDEIERLLWKLNAYQRRGTDQVIARKLRSMLASPTDTGAEDG